MSERIVCAREGEMHYSSTPDLALNRCPKCDSPTERVSLDNGVRPMMPLQERRRMFAPEDACWSRESLVETLLDRSQESSLGGVILDESKVEDYYERLTDVVMYKFVNGWYHWTSAMDELPDTAPLRQEEMLVSLARMLVSDC